MKFSMRCNVIAMALCTGFFASGPNAQSPMQAAAQFVTEHEIEIAGESISYIATAGETLLRDEYGKPMAAIWSTAYLGSGFNTPERPVVFVFNGGPGAASGEMQIGFIGPKIVQSEATSLDDDGIAPFILKDNPDSLFDVADFVIVDPVGTGFSRALGTTRDAEFWSMAADTASMADFIYQWVSTHQRGRSPKYILGLSYGTTRAVSVASKLREAPRNMELSGLMLHGPALDFIALDPLVGNPLSHVSFFPTMAAIAHHHGKAGKGQPLEGFLLEARRFARTDYFAGLMQGAAAPIEERRQLAERMAVFIGLAPQFILDARLRVPAARFRSELLREEGLVVGYSDGGYVAKARDPKAVVPMVEDPSSFVVDYAYGAALNEYFAEDLEVSMDRPYLTWNPEVGKNWRWSPDLSVFSSPQAYRQAKRTGRIEVASQLAKALAKNRNLRVSVAMGYFDLYTPFFDAERVFANFGIDQSRVEMNYYESGHLIWIRDAQRAALVADLRQFLSAPLR